MSIEKTFLGSNSEGGSDTNVAVTVNTAAGSQTHIVIAVGFEGGGATTVALSDSVGGLTDVRVDLTQANHANGDLNTVFVYAKLGGTDATHTFTITFGAARAFKRIAAWGVVATSGAVALVDQEAATGTSTSYDAGSLVNGAADSVVAFMAATPYTDVTFTASGGWTEDVNSPGGLDMFGASRGPETTSPIDPLVTADSAAWACAGILLKEDSGGGGGGGDSLTNNLRNKFNSRRPRGFAPGSAR